MKTTRSNSRKIEIFSKGVSPLFWSNICHFSIFLFQVIQSRKMFFRIFQKEKTPFQAIKTRSSKSRKIQIFSKGANPWFWSKIGHFSIFLFQVIQARKMCFRILQKDKTPFQAIKTRSQKSRKIQIFCKGGFGPKLAIFPCFYFGQYRPGKCVLRYSRRKKPLSKL